MYYVYNNKLTSTAPYTLLSPTEYTSSKDKHANTKSLHGFCLDKFRNFL